MGSTLTNGIYLPAEGERNCYTGLAANWSALDSLIGGYNAHIGNTTIHVTAEDKQAWNGKADASALTAHTGDTTIHVTAEDKAKWDAVTSKADNSDVVHKSGTETISGVKTFAGIPVFASFDGIRFRCAHNSNAYITFRKSNQANPGSIILAAHDGNVGTVIHLVNKALIPYNTNDMDLGTTSRKWKSFNGLNPSSLGMPDLSNGIDISSYLDTSQNSINYYTPPVNGWISIKGRSGSTSGIVIIQDGMAQMGYSIIDFNSSDRVSFCSLPVKGGVQVEIWLKSVTTLDSAKFFPCQGNV